MLTRSSDGTLTHDVENTPALSKRPRLAGLSTNESPPIKVAVLGGNGSKIELEHHPLIMQTPIGKISNVRLISI